MERGSFQSMSDRFHLAANPWLAIAVAVAALGALTGEESSKHVRCTGGIGLIQASLQTSKATLPTDLLFSEDADESSLGAPSSQRTAFSPAKKQKEASPGRSWDRAVNLGRVLFQKASSISESAETVAVSLVALGTARMSSSMVWLLLLGIILFCFAATFASSRWGSSLAARDLSGLTPPGWRPGTVGKDSNESLTLPAHAFSKQTLVSARHSVIQPRNTATSRPETPATYGRLSAKEEVLGKSSAAAGPALARSPQASIGSTLGSEFCPDLVVPKACECILLVPIVPLSRERFSVYDPSGEVVLHVLPENAGRRSPTSPCSATAILRLKSILRTSGASKSKHASVGSKTMDPSFHLELTTSAGDLLAQTSCQCPTPRDSPERSSQPKFQLMRADGDHYATLRRKAEGRYELSTPVQTIYFSGSFNHYAANITDATGKLLTTTELMSTDFDPAGKYYQLQVAPLVDVGLLLCSLICIGHVESFRRQTRT
eukprot:TRINITY_DN12402_c0_g2_i1.p1 TRINITY_DN12402_c0_g2~~TRINITY_DN12402_c0_g2_i1.p1  ORF type:complete len:505 (+),score=55.45 TRINITY_DN12402_c0_g2_i1:51-1517(+)